MNLSKKITYLITFLIVFLALPYGAYKFYYKYESDLYLSLSEFSSYTTLDGTYSVKAMDTKQFGSEDTVDLKIYLINNVTDEATYICRSKQNSYKNDILYQENKSDDSYTVTVTLTSEQIQIDCLNAKKLRSAGN